jgi:predicted kinase
MDMSKTTLIIIAGLPGSGKSTLAESLAEKLAIPLFSVDPIETAILKSGIKRSFATGLAVYLVAEMLAGEQLKYGLSAIIDAVSPVQEARDMWRNLAYKQKATLVIIECVLEREVHRKRIEARTRNMYGIPEVTWEDVETRREQYVIWQEERLVLDTAVAQDENVKKAIEYINTSRER